VDVVNGSCLLLNGECGSSKCWLKVGIGSLKYAYALSIGKK